MSEQTELQLLLAAAAKLIEDDASTGHRNPSYWDDEKEQDYREAIVRDLDRYRERVPELAVVPLFVKGGDGELAPPESLTSAELYARYVWIAERKIRGNLALHGPERPSQEAMLCITDPLLRDVMEAGMHNILGEMLAIQRVLQSRPDGRELLFPGMAEVEAKIAAEKGARR